MKKIISLMEFIGYFYVYKNSLDYKNHFSFTIKDDKNNIDYILNFAEIEENDVLNIYMRIDSYYNNPLDPKFNYKKGKNYYYNYSQVDECINRIKYESEVKNIYREKKIEKLLSL